VLLAALAGTAVGVLAFPVPASAYPAASVSFEGHGYGPGDGMGQWGALGDALAGTGYSSILDHFYGGTTLAGLSSGQEATQVRVAVTENDDNTVIVTSHSPFSVQYTLPGGATGSISVGGGQAVLMSPVAGAWDVASGPSCGGPWADPPTRTGVTNPTAVPSANPGLGDPNTATQALQLCQIGGNLTVRGSIEATLN
jgi:hypothetical protein